MQKSFFYFQVFLQLYIVLDSKLQMSKCIYIIFDLPELVLYTNNMVQLNNKTMC